MTFIFPTVPDTKEIDPEYKAELNYIKNHTNHKTILVDIELKQILNKTEDECIYRGWMLTESEYNWLSSNFNLNISTKMYLNNHYIINWYEKIKDLTFNSYIYSAVSEMMSDNNFINQKYILKNYVKSFYDKNGVKIVNSREEAKDIVEKDVYNVYPGIVFREFEDLDIDSEIRIFIYDNKPIWKPEIPYIVFEAIKKLNREYLYTIDVIKTKSGDWKIVEIGDGQVSSLKENSIKDFYMMF